MIETLKLTDTNHSHKIRDKDKMHREQREFELIMRRLQLTKENLIF